IDPPRIDADALHPFAIELPRLTQAAGDVAPLLEQVPVHPVRRENTAVIETVPIFQHQFGPVIHACDDASAGGTEIDREVYLRIISHDRMPVAAARPCCWKE